MIVGIIKDTTIIDTISVDDMNVVFTFFSSGMWPDADSYVEIVGDYSINDIYEDGVFRKAFDLTVEEQQKMVEDRLMALDILIGVYDDNLDALILQQTTDPEEVPDP